MNWYKVAKYNFLCSWLNTKSIDIPFLREHLRLPKDFKIRQEKDGTYSVIFRANNFVIVSSEPTIKDAVELALSRLEYMRKMCE